MRYISLFSGIEAATLAWEPLGWEAMAFCEIDAFPSAVLAERWPNVPNLGDITKVDWEEFVREHGRPDVVVGGSPCQSFSVAGGRESLGGESRLMFEYIRAVREIQPRWILWENVPGVLNVRDNAFGQLLQELQGVGYVSLSWRIFDAQFVRVAERDGDGRITGWVGPVAQRRRRVFLVGHLGTGGGAAAVLFERESVSGNTMPSTKKREALTAEARECLDRANRERGIAIAQDAADESQQVGSAGFCGYASHTAKTIGYQDELAPSLKGNDWQSQVPDVLLPTFAVRTAQTGANRIGVSEESSHTLDTNGPECVFVKATGRGDAEAQAHGPCAQSTEGCA